MRRIDVLLKLPFGRDTIFLRADSAEELALEHNPTKANGIVRIRVAVCCYCVCVNFHPFSKLMQIINLTLCVIRPSRQFCETPDEFGV